MKPCWRKCRAVVLILLLVGQDAVRLRDLLTDPDTNQKSTAEKELHTANKKCHWSLLRFRCSGGGCQFRPLPLDRPLPSSDSCRLSDKYMLKNESTSAHFVKLNAELMEAKAEKYRKSCKGVTHLWGWLSKRQWRCFRRVGHLMRSSRLLAEAGKTQEFQNSRELQDVVQRSNEKVVRTLADAFGKEGTLVKELLQKLKKNPYGIVRDPAGQIKRVVDNLVQIASGAKPNFDDLDSESSSKPLSKEELAETAEKAEANGGDSSGEAAFDEIDTIFADGAKDAAQASALLELGRSDLGGNMNSEELDPDAVVVSDFGGFESGKEFGDVDASKNNESSDGEGLEVVDTRKDYELESENAKNPIANWWESAKKFNWYCKDNETKLHCALKFPLRIPVPVIIILSIIITLLAIHFAVLPLFEVFINLVWDYQAFTNLFSGWLFIVRMIVEGLFIHIPASIIGKMTKKWQWEATKEQNPGITTTTLPPRPGIFRKLLAPVLGKKLNKSDFDDLEEEAKHSDDDYVGTYQQEEMSAKALKTARKRNQERRQKALTGNATALPNWEFVEDQKESASR